MDTQAFESLGKYPLEGLTSSLNGILFAITIGSVVITVIVLVFWVINRIHQREVQRAIIEIRNILKEMNERDKREDLSPRLAAIHTDSPATTNQQT
ncbi:MAG TPA: hypothetical protein PKD19_01970 [Candidatus Saccharibacteria bacterium]|nr:hypothetical protein [Candidatus Saccharibacteria bacterium]HMR38302.1 hypothetical protein [Candidatus Saccharibacteria bacterium]